MTRPTIYDIKCRTQDSSPYFFERKTLKFFGQTMKSFTVKKLSETEYSLTAGMFDHSGKYVGMTNRIFNTTTNKLERPL